MAVWLLPRGMISRERERISVHASKLLVMLLWPRGVVLVKEDEDVVRTRNGAVAVVVVIVVGRGWCGCGGGGGGGGGVGSWELEEVRTDG